MVRLPGYLTKKIFLDNYLFTLFALFTSYTKNKFVFNSHEFIILMI